MLRGSDGRRFAELYGSEWIADRSRGQGIRAGLSVASSFVGVRDARSGSRRGSLEVCPPCCGCHVSDEVDRVVLVQLALRMVRHEPENADVWVGHDRALGSGNAIKTAVAWGSSWGRSSGPTRRNRRAHSRPATGWGESPHSGQAIMYAAAAGVNRSRQAGQQTWVMAALARDSCRAGRPRTRGRPGSSRGRMTTRHPTRRSPVSSEARHANNVPALAAVCRSARIGSAVVRKPLRRRDVSVTHAISRPPRC